MIRPFLIALQFLTRLPVRLDDDLDERDLGRSILYYPWIGLMLGLLLAASAWLLERVPVLLGGALLLTIWVISTGALHLDGLADSVDAWAGGHGDRERTLAIMKDPCCGPMGVVAVMLVLLVKFGALAALCEAGARLEIALTPVLGRTVLPLLFLTTLYVRPSGLGTALAVHLPRRAAGAAVAATSVIVFMLGGVLLLLASAGIFLLLRAAMQQRIGGTTGDTAGALVELTETAVLVVAVIIGSFSPGMVM